jgi:hypothetical protein
MGFGLVNGFIDHLCVPLGTTSTHSAIADLHTLQIARAHAKSSQSALTSCFLVTDLNNGDSSASVLTLLPAGYHSTAELSTELIAPTVVVVTSRHRPQRTQFFYRCMHIRCHGNVFTEPLPFISSSVYIVACWSDCRRGLDS